MALQKETKTDMGVSGNNLSITHVSHNKQSGVTEFEVSLFVSEEVKSDGAKPLGTVFRGSTDKVDISQQPLEQIYKELLRRAEETVKSKQLKAGWWSKEHPTPDESDFEEIDIPKYPEEHRLFFGAENV